MIFPASSHSIALYLNCSTCCWCLGRGVYGSLFHFGGYNVWDLWLWGRGGTSTVVATRLLGGMQESLWWGWSPLPAPCPTILQDSSCPARFTNTQLTSYTPLGQTLVTASGLKVSVYYFLNWIECAIPRSALLSGPKQVRLFGDVAILFCRRFSVTH